MATSDTASVVTLEHLIESGVFASQIERLADEVRQTATWYHLALAEDGRAAAEHRLDEWLERSRRYSFAPCLESIARGVLAMAKVRPNGLVDITACEADIHSTIQPSYGPRRKFVLFGTDVHGFEDDSRRVSSYEGFNIRAVILEAGYTAEGPDAKVGLVLPVWGTAQYAPVKGEFAIVTLETSGFSSGSGYHPLIRTDEGLKDFSNVAASLKHLLGMSPIEELAVQTSVSGVEILGFPGATDYLAAKLPGLGGYLIALAARLSSGHAH